LLEELSALSILEGGEELFESSRGLRSCSHGCC
jgi:hypothetical protein